MPHPDPEIERLAALLWPPESRIRRLIPHRRVTQTTLNRAAWGRPRYRLPHPLHRVWLWLADHLIPAQALTDWR